MRSGKLVRLPMMVGWTWAHRVYTARLQFNGGPLWGLLGALTRGRRPKGRLGSPQEDSSNAAQHEAKKRGIPAHPRTVMTTICRAIDRETSAGSRPKPVCRRRTMLEATSRRHPPSFAQ